MRIPTQHTFVVIRNSLAHKILYTSSKRFSILPKVFASQMAFLFSLIHYCGHHVVKDSYNNYNVFHLYIQLKVHTAAFLLARSFKVNWGHLYTGSVLCTSSHTSSKSSSYFVSAIHFLMPLFEDSDSFIPARGQLRSSSTCTFYMHVTPMGLDWCSVAMETRLGAVYVAKPGLKRREFLKYILASVQKE